MAPVFPTCAPVNPVDAPRRRGGFTLIELLVVMALIGLMAGVVLTAISGMDETQTLDASVNKVSGYFNLARSTAITRKTPTRVLIHFNPNDKDRYLRYILVVYEDPNESNPNTRWKVLAEGEYLSKGVFFSPVHSTSTVAPSLVGVTWQVDYNTFLGTSAMSAPSTPSAGANAWVSYEFLPNGNAARPMSRAVFANGIVNGAALNVPNPNNLAGFAVFRSGQTLGFQDIRQIQQ